VSTRTRDKNDFLALLSGVRRVFAESQEYESTLAAIAHLVLPYLGSWCAVDVCQEVAPEHRMAGLLADLLTDAVPPSAWERVRGVPA